MAKCEGHIHRVKHDTRTKPERNATVYVLHQEGRLSTAEIARQFNVSPSAVCHIVRKESERRAS